MAYVHAQADNELEPPARMCYKNEAPVYSAAHGLGLTAPLVGWLTENGGDRVVGYAVAHVSGGRIAGPEDEEACRAALARLHALGFAYGARLRRDSFIVLEEGERGADADKESAAEDSSIAAEDGQEKKRALTKVLMQDFMRAHPSTDKDEMKAEMDGLPHALTVRQKVAPTETFYYNLSPDGPWYSE